MVTHYQTTILMTTEYLLEVQAQAHLQQVNTATQQKVAATTWARTMELIVVLTVYKKLSETLLVKSYLNQHWLRGQEQAAEA